MELAHTTHSSGVAKAGLATGIIGTSLGVLNGGGGLLGGLFGNNCGGWGWGRSGCGYGVADIGVSRFELAQQNEIAAKDARIALLEANTYGDQKLLEVYRYFDGKVAALEQENVRLSMALQRERDERCCSDNAIVGYVNATFYPKQVADVTVGATTTAQAIYNPIPRCGCGCGNGNGNGNF